MSNAFQDQLLKAGLVTKQQVQKANKSKHKKSKNQSKKQTATDNNKIKKQQQATEKAKRDSDLELNKKKEHQAKQKAISIEINQLITTNTIKRDDKCEIIYNFEHNKKVKRIYINNDMKQQIIKGQLGIARIEGRYELVPKDIAEKIQQRNEKRIILFTNEQLKDDENDPYADFKIPDDLTW